MADRPVALVTGGAVRVGRAIASALAEDGYRLVIHYNTSAGPAEELVDQIRSNGGEAVAIGADLADAEAVRRLAREAVDAFGGIDVLVNNASTFPVERLEEVDEELWDHSMAVNLKAPFFLIRHLAATLRERRGAVINMADVDGIQSWGTYVAHGIGKAGLLHLTRVAARALAPEVRVNAIAPSTVLPTENLSAEHLQQLADKAPLKRHGSPEDVVRAVRYLLAADFVTGQTMVLDGGRLLRG